MKSFYSDKHCEIFCGDCLSVLKDLEDDSIDLILTDPPYDKATHDGGVFGAESSFGDVDFSPVKDYNFIGELLRISRTWVIVFCPVEALGRIQDQYYSRYVRGIIWDKINTTPQMSGDRPAQAVEGIALLHTTRKKMKWNGGGKAGIYRHSVERGRKVHPTQKPLKLIFSLLADFLVGETVFDPFMGGGTTLRAAKDLGKKSIGIEISEEYCGVAVERLQQEVLF